MIQWIGECISTSRFSININGELCGFFSFRGQRVAPRGSNIPRSLLFSDGGLFWTYAKHGAEEAISIPLAVSKRGNLLIELSKKQSEGKAVPEAKGRQRISRNFLISAFGNEL
jgi:hypothetical protein